jgi:hypothetical protein
VIDDVERLARAIAGGIDLDWWDLGDDSKALIRDEAEQVLRPDVRLASPGGPPWLIPSPWPWAKSRNSRAAVGRSRAPRCCGSARPWR